MINLLRASVVQTVQNEMPRTFTFSELERMSKHSLIHIVIQLQKEREDLQSHIASLHHSPSDGLSDSNPIDEPGAHKVDEEGSTAISTWSEVVGDVADSFEMCDSWTLRDCPSCRRILFCLRYYKKWLSHKLKEERLKCSLPPKAVKEYLKDFISALSGYSSVSMLNDFHHIKQYHLDRGDVLSFFRRELGHCQYTECRCYSRNNRDRGKMSSNEPLRRKMYFLPTSLTTSKEGEIEETNIQQLFDMIHCATMHCTESTSGRSSRNSKFVTVIGGGKEKVSCFGKRTCCKMLKMKMLKKLYFGSDLLTCSLVDARDLRF